MSYVIHVWESPIPRDLDHAWDIIDELSESSQGSPPPALVEFVKQILVRYPNWGDLPDDELTEDSQVWGDGDVDAGNPLLVLGICSAWVERAQPFVVQVANNLGLVCYDMQLGELYLPA